MTNRRVSVIDKIKNDFLELQNDDNRPETFKDTLKDLAENSSLHGIPKIVHSRQIVVKVLWCLLVLGAFGVFTIQLYHLFKTFYSYPSQTSVSLEFSPIAFPSITLCNMNPVRKSQIYKATELELFLQSQSNKLLSARRRRKREAAEKRSNVPMENSDTNYDKVKEKIHHKLKIHRMSLSETESKSNAGVKLEQNTTSITGQVFDIPENSAFFEDTNTEIAHSRKGNIQDIPSDVVKQNKNSEFENLLLSENILKDKQYGGLSHFQIEETYENDEKIYEMFRELPTKPDKQTQKGIRRRKREAIASFYHNVSDVASSSPVSSSVTTFSSFETDALETTSYGSISPTATSVFQYSTADISPSASALQSLISPEVPQSTEELTSSTAVSATPPMSDNGAFISNLNDFNSVSSNELSSIYPTTTEEGSSYPSWSNWYSAYSSYYYYDWTSWFDYMYENEYGASWNSWNSWNDFSGNLFFYDQLVSSKDEWDERMDNFRQIFKNQSLKMRNEIGHQKEDMILSATFAGRVQNVSQFKTFMSTEYGNCYTLASPKYVAWRSGPAHGIKLTLNLELDEYIENFSPGYGIRIVFHEPGTYPLPSHDGITLSPATETNIGLRMVRIRRLTEPHGNCIDGTEFEARYDKKYSISACYEFCRIHKAMQECNCIPVEAPDEVYLNTTVHSVCNESKITVKKCLLDVDVLFDNGAIDCDCRGPCKETVYSKTMSSTYWPADDYLELLLSDICEKKNTTEYWTDVCYNFDYMKYWELDKYRDNFLRVLVYYEDLNYESISEEPMYESVRFLSDIGGAMGLFLGASVLSFVEAVQLILEIFLYIKHKGDKKNRVIDLKK